MSDGGTTCAHGDQLCPCNDGDPCHYEDVEINGHISPAAPCRNSDCAVCR